jgi:hypothetical protein
MDMKKDVLIGKTLDEAREILRNCKWRIRNKDGKAQLGTSDVQPERYNLSITNNIVTGVHFG